jgi:uncharacterized damage-inducible protein DinB
MSVSADALRLHIDYTAWASGRLLEAATALTAEELTRDFKSADKTLLDTLVHVFAADRIWLSRLRGAQRATFLDPEDRQLSALQREWPALLDNWKRHVAGIDDEQAKAHISYKDLKGNAHTQPMWQILLHVVNHGTHHRGQAAGFIRAMGYKPPALDLIAFYRSLSSAA